MSHDLSAEAKAKLIGADVIEQYCAESKEKAANKMKVFVQNTPLPEDDIEEWEYWAAKRRIIDGHGQKRRDFCISRGNSKNQCICAFESANNWLKDCCENWKKTLKE